MRRRVVRISVGLAVAFGLLLLFTLDVVDYRPALRQPYYAETRSRLEAHCATNGVIYGELHAGFGRALLTPFASTNSAPRTAPGLTSVPLAGYGARKGRPATGVHDDLFVKAVALRVENRAGVLVSADALIVPEEVSALVEKGLPQLGLTREQLYLAATHTHSSLGGWGQGTVAEAFAGDFVPGVREWFAGQILSAIQAALADLKPATCGAGRFAAADLVRNRLVGEAGEVDPEFSFLVLKQQEGITAVLGSFSAHATVLSHKVMQFSGDYPGAWQRGVERATGGMALFLAGGMGSHAPIPHESGFTGAERMGNVLAAALVDELASVALTNGIHLGIAGVQVELPSLNWRVTAHIRLRPWVARRLLKAPERAWVQAFRIGDLVWLSTPCDYSGESTIRLKEMLRAHGGDGVVTSFNGSYIGYVIPDRYYHLPGYEPRVMSFFGPNLPDYLDEVLRRLALCVLPPAG